MPARSCWLPTLYWPVAATWIWSQSTYWTLPPTAVAWAKAGAAAASTMATTAANNNALLIPYLLTTRMLIGKPHLFIPLLHGQRYIMHDSRLFTLYVVVFTIFRIA